MRKKSLWIIILMAICISIPLFYDARNVGAATPIVLKHASYWPADEPCQMVCEWWMSEIEKRTNGRVKWQRHLAESLVKAVDLLDGISAGICDAGPTSVGYTPSKLPLCSGFELPYLIPSSSIWVQAKAISDLYQSFPAFQKELSNYKLKFIGTIAVPNGVFVTRTGKQIKSLDDFKGLKLRAYGPVGKTIRRLGGVGVSMPAPEMYTATQRGTVDGAFFTFASIPPFKMHEVTKYITLNTGLEIYCYIQNVMNVDAWNKLPPDIQRIIEEVNKEWAENVARIWTKEEEKTVSFLKTKGLVFYELPNEEKARWKTKVDPGDYYNEWIKEKTPLGIPAADLIEKYQTLIKKYESQDKYYRLPVIE